MKIIPFLKSAGAIVVGFFAVAFLSIATDIFLEAFGIMPRDPQVYLTGSAYISFMLLIALIYRGFYGALGSYIAAKLAPSRPMFPRYAARLDWICDWGTCGLLQLG